MQPIKWTETNCTRGCLDDMNCKNFDSVGFLVSVLRRGLCWLSLNFVNKSENNSE